MYDPLAAPQQPGLSDFIGPLLAFDQLASSFRQWRLHRDLVKSFKCLVTCMTSEQIHAKFVPLVLKYISGNVCEIHTCGMQVKVIITYLQVVLPVRQAAAYSLCLFIRFNRRQDQRNELISWIIEG